MLEMPVSGIFSGKCSLEEREKVDSDPCTNGFMEVEDQKFSVQHHLVVETRIWGSTGALQFSCVFAFQSGFLQAVFS